MLVVFGLWATGHLSVQQNIVNNTTSTTTGLANSSCASAPIESELTTYNSQAITSGTVSVYQINSAGSFAKLSDASGSQTLNTYNSASSYYSVPWVATWNASAAYPQTFSVSSVPSTDANGDSVACQVPAGSSNSVNVFQEKGFVYLAPASGKSAVTNVQSIVGSSTTQTNSFPAAFPTTSLSVTAYLQGFSANSAGLRNVQLASSVNQPRTDYGTTGTPQSVLSTGNLVTYQGVVLVLFNQTGIAFSGPAGTVPLSITGQTGEKGWAIPVGNGGVCASAGVGTGSPCILNSVSFNVQETIAATGHHISMAIIWLGLTQIGYIQQYISTPAVTGVGWNSTGGVKQTSAGGYAGLPAGFAGFFAPEGGSTGGLYPIIEQYSIVKSTY